MHTEIQGTTRRVVFDVRPSLNGKRAVLDIVPGEAPSGLYLWIGAPDGSGCIGTIDGAELKKLARAILGELAGKRTRPRKTVRL